MKECQNRHKPKPKMIVMPLTPANGQEYNGTGLGIHFFLGNVMAMHDMLSEFWFGWRVRKLFAGKALLKDYCRGRQADLDIQSLGKTQGIRYWLSGRYKEDTDDIAISLTLADTEVPQKYTSNFKLDIKNRFSDFYCKFFNWIADCGLPFSKRQAANAAWPEKMDAAGLDFLGRALDVTYTGYVEEAGAVNTDAYEKCIASSPESYMAHDLYAWALYKNKSYDSAIASFQRSLTYNNKGLGALAGLMWCGIFTGDREKAIQYALLKAAARNDDPDNAKAFVSRKIGY